MDTEIHGHTFHSILLSSSLSMRTQCITLSGIGIGYGAIRLLLPSQFLAHKLQQFAYWFLLEVLSGKIEPALLRYARFTI